MLCVRSIYGIRWLVLLIDCPVQDSRKISYVRERLVVRDQDRAMNRRSQLFSLLGTFLVTISQKVLWETGFVESRENLVPPAWRLGQNQVSTLRVAADVDFIRGEAVLGRNSDSLAPSGHEDFRFLLRHGPASDIYRAIYQLGFQVASGAFLFLSACLSSHLA
jgi:hypothetical protein